MDSSESFSDPKRLRWLTAHVREAYIMHGRKFFDPGFHAIAVYRFGVWIGHKPRLVRYLLNVIYKVLAAFVRNLYGVELLPRTRVGRGLRLPHPVGVVISPAAEIGNDCLIRQNVTIGRFDRGRKRSPPFAPKLGDGVEVGAGAVVVGGITIGDQARIGPNAVVTTNIPAGGSAFAPPTKVMAPLRKVESQKVESVHEE